MPIPDIAQHSLSAGESLTATAPRSSIWILLEYTGPWGEKALDESDLPDPVKAFLNNQITTLPNARFQFIKQGEMTAAIRLYIANANPVMPMLYRFRLDSYEDLLDMDFRAIATGQVDQTLSEDRLFLVCTNGKKDACCAKNGLPLYNALASVAGKDVWQVTHIGGHRFAGTLVCLPHGVYYGRVSPEDALTIVQAYRKNTLLLKYYRGCSAYDAPAQAVEMVLRQQTEARAIDAFRLKHIQPDGDMRWLVQFDASDGAQHQLHVRAQPSTFSIYESTRDAQPKTVMQYIIEA